LIDAGDYPAATASISQSLAMFSDLGERGLGSLRHPLPRPRAAADRSLPCRCHQLAPRAPAQPRAWMPVPRGRNADLPRRPGRPRRRHRPGAPPLLRRPGRRPPGRACPKRKRPPWKASAGSTSRTAIPAKQPAAWRQALIIYQRAGNPAAQRLQHTLADHGLQPTGWPPSSDKAARSTPNRMTTASRRPR